MFLFLLWKIVKVLDYYGNCPFDGYGLPFALWHHHYRHDVVDLVFAAALVKVLCNTFSGSVYFSFIFYTMVMCTRYVYHSLGSYPASSVGPVRMLKGTEQRSKRFSM